MSTASTMNLSGGPCLGFGETGTGPTVVMVHGSPGEGRAWNNVIKQLPDSVRVLTPDLPGYGRSDPLPGGTTHRTQAMADAVAELIEQQDGAVWLCGHSYGANVALHAAVRLGSKLAGLVLIEPVFLRVLQLVQDDAQYNSAQAFFADYVRRVESAEPDAIRLMIDFWCGTGYFDRLPERARGFLNSAAPQNAADVRATFSETLGLSDLQGLDIPVLLASGDRSPKIAESMANSCRQWMPNARTQSIEGATHLLLDSHAAQVAELIQQCLGAQAER